MSGMLELMTKLKREITHGGELKDQPCPFCKKPRSQRSDYLRCSSCATNWLQGESTEKDPRKERFDQFLKMQTMAGVRSIENKR